jgi:hypothetical protein
MVVLMVSCNSHKIRLEVVSFLPEYFSSGKHFGLDITSIQQQNQYLLVTGKVDTTSEVPPLKMAVVVIDKNKIFLNFIRSTKINDATTEEYSGSGYNLKVIYTVKGQGLSAEQYAGTIFIKRGNLDSEYKVVGLPGNN